MKCTGRNCPMQYGTVDPAHCLAADECLYVTKPLTNADRIRAMSDEQLAKFFENITFCDYCFIIKNEYETERYSCEQRWIDWLKQEVDDG